MEKLRMDSLVITDSETSAAFVISDEEIVVVGGDRDPEARLVAVVGNKGAVAAEIDGEVEKRLDGGTKVYVLDGSVWFEEE